MEEVLDDRTLSSTVAPLKEGGKERSGMSVDGAKSERERQLRSADRDLVLQGTESVLHVLVQLRVIGFNLRLSLLHRVLRERARDDQVDQCSFSLFIYF